MAIGDMIFDLMGRPDPRRQLAAALTGGAGMGAPNPLTGPPQDGGGLSAMAAGGGGQPGAPAQLPGADPATAAPPGAPPAPAAPPQPQAYQSPPDLGKMYMDLVTRQQANEQINRGAGLLFGAFAQPQDRGPMLQAMTGQTGGVSGPGDIADNLGKIYQMQVGMQMQRQMMQNAPTFAKQLNIPVEQVYALIAQGKLPEIMQDVEKQRLLQGDPLHIAQTGSAQAEIPLKQAQTTAEQAKVPLTQAQVIAEQAKVPLTQAQTAEAQATAAKTQQDVAARTKLMNSVPDISKSTGIDPIILASLPPDKLAELATKASEPTEASKNYKQARAELVGQGFSPDMVNTLAPPEMLIAGASADPMFRSYIQQRASAMKTDPSSPAATQSFEQFKTATTVQQQTATEQAKAQTGAKQQLDDLSAQYDKQQELIKGISAKQGVLNEITGKVAGRLPTSIAPWASLRGNSQEAIDLQAKMDQLADMGFITGAHAVRQAVGGKVTNTEAKAGNEAETRLHDQSQSLSGYNDSLQQVKDESDRQMAIAYKEAGIPIPDKYPDVKAAAAKLTPGTGPAASAPIKKVVRNSKGQLEFQ